MKISLILLVFASAAWGADKPAQALFDAVEQHLRALQTLDIEYLAAGSALGDDSVAGRIVLERPDRFFHDTPEWTVCESAGEQWRYLKDQRTLIRDRAPEESDFLPETVLLDLRRLYRPRSLAVNADGTRRLQLDPLKRDAAGAAALEFAATGLAPVKLIFETADGLEAAYVFRAWRENRPVDEALFDPPPVNAENLIDFRASGERQ